MNEAIKLNPNFQTAFHDRGTAYVDRRDYDDSDRPMRRCGKARLMR